MQKRHANRTARALDFGHYPSYNKAIKITAEINSKETRGKENVFFGYYGLRTNDPYGCLIAEG